MIETDVSREAKNILNEANLVIAFGEKKVKAIFTSAEIGQETLIQQEKTREKKEEENSRIENQRVFKERKER